MLCLARVLLMLLFGAVVLFFFFFSPEVYLRAPSDLEGHFGSCVQLTVRKNWLWSVKKLFFLLSWVNRDCDGKRGVFHPPNAT